MSGVDELVTFVRAALDRDEQVALAATAGPWWHDPGKAWLGPEAFEAYDLRKGEEFVGYGESPFSGCIAATGPGSHVQSMADAEHIARWDPARVLAEVQAKRAILDLAQPAVMRALATQDPDFRDGYVTACEDAVKLLAQPYAGQPGWREEWQLSAPA